METVREDTSSRWRRVEAVFHRLLDVDPAERAGLLAAAVPDDATRAEVRSLLDAHAAAGGFLDAPAFAEVRDDNDARDAIRPGQDRIGGHRLVRVLGRGGMGVVYEAEQDHPRRTVALKVLRRGGPRDELQVRLFRREIEALARLVHPGIARIHEAGVTPGGEDWFTMELVPGRRLDRWAAEAAPPLRRRLEVFREVCAAVAFAHLRGVIHCDLKPSNILVGDGAEAGAVKVLDFGLARFAGPGADETSPEHMQGSLAYMSPEQTRLRDEEIDVRADVYALGVILYELVAGRRPYAVDGLLPTAAAAAICGTPPAPLDPGTPRDLAAAIARALAKEPAVRYASAAAFGDDIGRILAGEPTAARPPGRAEAAWRFVRRHRFGVGAAAVLVLLLAAFAAVSAVQASRFAAQRDEALRQQRLVERVVAWWGGNLVGATQPVAPGDPAAGLKEMLRRRADDIEAEFAGESRMQAQLHQIFASTWRSLGDPAPAVVHLERAAALREAAFGRGHPETLSALNNLAVARSGEGRFAEAGALYREVLDARRASLPADDPQVLTSLHNLGSFQVQCGRFEEAEPMLREALAGRRRALPPDHEDVHHARKSLAGLLMHLGRHEEAEALIREALDALRRSHPGHHPRVLALATMLAQVLLQRGAWEACDAILGSAASTADAELGGEHEVSLGLQDVLAMLRARQGRFDEAAAAGDRAYAGRKSRLGAEHPDTLVALRHRAMIWKSQGAADRAEAAFRELHEIQQRTLPPEHPSVLSVLNQLYVLYADAGKWERAETLIEEAEADLALNLGPEHPSVLALRSDLGRVALFRGEIDRAAALLEDAHAAQRLAHGDEHERTLRTAGYVAELRRRQGRAEEAVALGRTSLEIIRRRHGSRHQEALAALSGIGLALEDLRNHAEAEPVFAELVEAMGEVLPHERAYRANVLAHRSRCLRELGRLAEADAALRAAERLLEGVSGHAEIRANVSSQRGRLQEASGLPADAGGARPSDPAAERVPDRD